MNEVKAEKIVKAEERRKGTGSLRGQCKERDVKRAMKALVVCEGTSSGLLVVRSRGTKVEAEEYIRFPITPVD